MRSNKSNDRHFRVGFRTDANIAIGGGHVMRCRTLAHALSSRGAECTFYSNEATEYFLRLNDKSNIVAVCDDQIDERLAHGEFGYFDAFVCDDYLLETAFETMLRPYATSIVVIDDLANRSHDCDVLIDMTLSRQPSAYDGLVSPRATVLTGVDYALLGPDFGRRRSASLARRTSDQIRRIFISFGLTDTLGLTVVAVQALRSALGMLPHFEYADIVVGSRYDKLLQLKSVVENDTRFRLHTDSSDVVRLMERADLAIGAAGTTSWERCCMGLPTLLTVTADNQEANAEALEQAGAVIVMPSVQTLQTDLESSLAYLAQAPATLLQLSLSAAAICDGLGATRIAELLVNRFEPRASQIATGIVLRQATLKDARILWEWRNDPETRMNSRSTTPVEWSNHLKWLARVIADPATILLVGEVENRSIGTVRFDPIRNDAREISIALAPATRGKGLGTRLLIAACRHTRVSDRCAVLARIRSSNLRSQAIFKKAGFVLERNEDDYVILYLH